MAAAGPESGDPAGGGQGGDDATTEPRPATPGDTDDDRSGGDTATVEAGTGEPDTARVPPRWTGSAAVPPPGARRRRRRFDDEEETWPVDVPPARNPDDPPTLEWPAPPPTRTWPAAPPPGAAQPYAVPPGAAPPGPAAPRPGPAGIHPPGPPPARRAGRPAVRPPGALPPGAPPGAPPGRGAGPPAPRPVRRRRRWPWVLLVLGVLSVLCCCGCAGVVWPYLKQYPTTVTLPASAAGLSRLDDADSRRVEAQLKVKMRTEQLLAEGVFAGRYGPSGGDGEPVTLFGTTGFHMSPDKDLDAALSDLGDQFSLTGLRAVPAGDLGGFQRCGSGESDGTAMTVCGWADHGSLAIGLFPGRDLDQGAQLLRELRAAVTHRTNHTG